MPELRLPELTQNSLIYDPQTGTPTADFLQKYNALVRALRDHENRLQDLEP